MRWEELGARDAVPLVDILYRHVKRLWMEGLACSEYTLWLPWWNLLAGLGDLRDTVTTISLLVVEGGTLQARVRDQLTT